MHDPNAADSGRVVQLIGFASQFTKHSSEARIIEIKVQYQMIEGRKKLDEV